MGAWIDIPAGTKHGRLTYVADIPDTRPRRLTLLCDCGRTTEVSAANWKRGLVASCGCLRQQPRSHGATGTPLHDAWRGMRQRCSPIYQTGRYANYAGVRCDPLWESFEGFRDNQPPGRPFEKGLCLARIGDVGDYTPTNCRWTTRSENTMEWNERHARRLPDGRFAFRVAKENGITVKALNLRITRGWALVEAVTRPMVIRKR